MRSGRLVRGPWAAGTLLASVAALISISGALLGPSATALPTQDPCERAWRGVRLEVFMTVTATDEQIADVDELLTTSPLVKRFRFLDKAAAYEEFKRIFRDDPALVANVDPNALPTSFRIVPKRPSTVSRIKQAADVLPGVDDVATPPTRAVVRACRRR